MSYVEIDPDFLNPNTTPKYSFQTLFNKLRDHPHGVVLVVPDKLDNGQMVTITPDPAGGGGFVLTPPAFLFLVDFDNFITKGLLFDGNNKMYSNAPALSSPGRDGGMFDIRLQGLSASGDNQKRIIFRRIYNSTEVLRQIVACAVFRSPSRTSVVPFGEMNVRYAPGSAVRASSLSFTSQVRSGGVSPVVPSPGVPFPPGGGGRGRGVLAPSALFGAPPPAPPAPPAPLAPPPVPLPPFGVSSVGDDSGLTRWDQVVPALIGGTVLGYAISKA